MRPRCAPSACRTAISRARTVARASSRFAIFVHAISNTRATMPISNFSGSENCRRSLKSRRHRRKWHVRVVKVHQVALVRFVVYKTPANPLEQHVDIRRRLFLGYARLQPPKKVK